MAIIVEDGTGKADSNSYVSVSEFNTFSQDRGVSYTGNVESLLIKSMDYVESLSFKGYRLSYDQNLSFPRSGVVIDGFELESSTIPRELKNMQMATAMAIAKKADPLAIHVDGIKSESVHNAYSVEYTGYGSGMKVSPAILALGRKLLVGGGALGVVRV